MNLLNLVTSKLNLNPQMVNTLKQAINLASKYQNNTNGLQQAINENGGIDKFKQAFNMLNNPKISNTLSKLGIDINNVKNISTNIINNNSVNNLDDIKSRLSKLQK